MTLYAACNHDVVMYFFYEFLISKIEVTFLVLELPFLVLNNGHTLHKRLCSLETVSYQFGNCSVLFCVQTYSHVQSFD